MDFEPKSLKGLYENVIFCECPRCGKSVGIDRRAAGKLISCPECSLRYQVPFPKEEEERMAISSQDTTRVPVASEKEGIIVNPEYMEAIHHQLAAIQNALDRITHVLQNIREENSF